MSVVQNDDAPAAGFDRWNEVDYNSIDYGYLSQMPNESEVGPGGGFYITTAINYANGPAHMGHAYEGVTADVIARYHRLLGDKPAFFVTGADEHGQKIAQTAEDANETPIDICNRFVTGFKVLNQRTLVSYDDYVRTTSDRHKRTAQELWKRCNESGDIYLDTYSGWYNVREETFVTEYDAKLSDYKDPSSGKPLKRVEEESYFFKMSKYQEQLIEHIETHLEFIQPTQHRNYILQRLRTDELRNLSISRNTFSWGIKVPSGFDESHVMYVWVDALTNYLTGVDRLGQNGGTVRAGLQNLWPADVHIIGKDILWFHTVIWPCLLMSADLPLAKTVFAHGFVNDGEGKKMSKSLGNVIDPHDMLDKFHVDTFRWYLCKESPYGGDLSFSEESMRDMHNADLCDTLGNLLHRITNLTHKYCAGVIPDVQAEGVLDYGSIIGQYNTKMQSYELQGGANVVMHALRDLNAYLQESAPWRLKGEANSSKRQTIVRTALESCYVLGHLLLPFIPNGGRTLFLKLGKKPVALCDLKTDGNNLTVGDAVSIGDVMYTKSLPPGAADSSNVVRETYEEAQKRKKEAKAKAQASSKRGQEANADQCDFTKMDIRVGQIVDVWNHEKADKLFCEKIDVGEDAPREIASGLRDHYSLESLQNRKVLVVCNLKASKLHDFVSYGMVLAAKSSSLVELVEPPEDSNVGERVFVEGASGKPFSSNQVKKKKVWEAVCKDLKTTDASIASWNGKPVLTSKGPCKVSSLCDAPIS